MLEGLTYLNDDKINQEFVSDKKEFRKNFIIPLAENLYKDIQKVASQKPFIFTISEFKDLSKSEKSLWYDYVSRIPDKFRVFNIFLRRFKDFCLTCIITDNEISSLAQMDQDFLQTQKSFQKSIKNRQKFLIELNYLIPVELKKIGYEVIRYEEAFEIKIFMIKRLARAIHSKYLHEIKNQSIKSEQYSKYSILSPASSYTSDFDDLPEEIQYSNIDNAAHIPTKLLSIGYKIRAVKKGFKPFALHLNNEETETMARVEHIRWSWEKRLNGWIYGPVKDDNRKTHPSLIPFEQLTESEKEKDRELVRLIPAFLQDIDYEAYPVSPNRIKKLSYALKPQSSIHRILEETRKLNDQIKEFFILSPSIEEMVRIRNKKIEEAISEVEGSYNYAQHIQETFLPDDFTIRETFPDSFILFKPKDIVSGDFYFFSKQNDIIIFAAADCTGHGIPGALLSILGYGILDQVVNEMKLTDPSLILYNLYKKIHRYLRKDSEDSSISDDMDIILCSLDTRTNTLNYSGVKNSLYRITSGELIEYKAQNTSGTECEDGDCQFKSTIIQFNISDVIYLFSDGYSDQFGGKNHKRYQTSKLRNFLQSLKDCSLPEQGDKLYEEIEKWREEKNEEQTDDILVLGIRI